MAKTNQAGADQAPATLEEAVALAQSYKERLATAEKEGSDLKEKLATAEKEGSDLKEKLATAEKEGSDLKEKLATAETQGKAADAALAKAEGVIESQAAELKDAQDVIDDLKVQLDEASKGKKKGPVVTIGTKTYLVLAGTVIKKVRYEPADIAADKELCKKLIAKGSTLLKETK